MTKTATINRPAIALLCGTLALAMGYGIGELALERFPPDVNQFKQRGIP